MNNLITIHPEIQSGTPVFFNTRVPIKNLFDYLKGGHTIAEFVDDFPSVKPEHAMAVLELASSTITFSVPDYDSLVAG